ncbi:MAG: hypothetical protein ACRDJS_02270 [Actinomycetota bacterium]
MRSFVAALTLAVALLPVAIGLPGRAQAPIEGGAEIGDAPRLEPGAYTGRIPWRETRYFAFTLAEGRKAAVELLVRGPSSNPSIPVRLRLYNSRGIEDRFAGGPAFVEAGERALLTARTGVAGHDPGYLSPGPHYLSVTAGSGGAVRGPTLGFDLRIDVESEAARRTVPQPHARAEEPARLPIYILSFLGGASLGAVAVAVRLKLREPASGLRRGL